MPPSRSDRDSTVQGSNVRDNSHRARRVRRRATVLAVLAVVSGVGSVLSMAFLVVQSHQPLPIWDEWVVLKEMAPTFERGLIPKRVFRHFYQHLIVFQRLAIYVDQTRFGGQGVFPKVAGFATHLLHGLLFMVWIRAGVTLAGAPRPGRVAWAGFALAVLFSAQHAIALRSGFQFSMVLSLAAATAAILAFQVATIETGIRRYPVAFAALLAGTVSSLSFGSGLLVWPTLVLLALLARPVPWVLGWVPATGVLGTVLARRVNPADLAGGHGFASIFEDPGLVLLRFLALVGIPARPAGMPAVLALGVVGALAAAALALWLLRRRLRVGALPFALCGPAAVAAFLLVAMGLAAAGRAGYGLEQATKERYGVLGAVLWLALLLAWWQARLHAPRTPRRLGDGVAAVVALGLVTAGLAAHVDRVARVAIWRLPFEHATSALLAGVEDRDLFAYVAHSHKNLRRVDPVLRSHRRSIYRDGRHLMIGRPLADAAGTGVSEACVGAVLSTSQRGGGVRLDGWAVDRSAAPVAVRRLLVVDGADRIVGFGVGGEPKDGLPPGAMEAPGPSGFVAFAGTGGEGVGGALRAVALLDDGSPCYLTGIP